MARHSRNKKLLKAREERRQALAATKMMILCNGRTLQPGSPEFKRALEAIADMTTEDELPVLPPPDSQS